MTKITRATMFRAPNFVAKFEEGDATSAVDVAEAWRAGAAVALIFVAFFKSVLLGLGIGAAWRRRGGGASRYRAAAVRFCQGRRQNAPGGHGASEI